MVIGSGKSQSDVTLRKLQAFVAVAEAGSITAAARQLGISQPTLSQLISGFEAQAGAQLFLREGGGVVPSDAGEALLRKAESVLNEFKEFGATLETLSFGKPVSLKVAALPSVMRMLVPSAIASMRDNFPALSLDGHEQTPSRIVDLLYRRTVHVGIVGAYSVPELSPTFSRAEVVSDPIVLVSPKNAASDLPFLHVELGSHASQRMALWFDAAFPRARSIMHLRSYETAVRFAEEGLGRCVVPLLSYLDAKQGKDVVVRLINDLPSRKVEAIIPQTHLRLPVYAEFSERLRNIAKDKIDAASQRLISL